MSNTVPKPVTPCGCGATCPFADADDPDEGVCWGEVHAVDNDIWFNEETGEFDGGYLHACQGHAKRWQVEGPYIKQAGPT